MDTSKVTRFEIINHTPCNNCGGSGKEYNHNYSQEVECSDCRGTGIPGRTVYFRNENLQLDVELQDDDRTLKVFIHERYE